MLAGVDNGRNLELSGIRKEAVFNTSLKESGSTTNWVGGKNVTQKARRPRQLNGTPSGKKLSRNPNQRTTKLGVESSENSKQLARVKIEELSRGCGRCRGTEVDRLLRGFRVRQFLNNPCLLRGTERRYFRRGCLVTGGSVSTRTNSGYEKRWNLFPAVRVIQWSEDDGNKGRKARFRKLQANREERSTFLLLSICVASDETRILFNRLRIRNSMVYQSPSRDWVAVKSE